ncbi:glycosyl hydrolase 2 galactose-binding domain-containing protein [Psychroserpens sp.]|uniref:beta-mannosidase n=1 Tax=Psychroserpens sp. TaxID=2020870 RepID=UPI0038587933
MKYSVFIIFIITLFGCDSNHDTPVTFELNSDWEFKSTKDSIWNSATVPGNVYTDLLNNKLIEDPFIGNNENKLQWISESDWEYKTNFLVDKATLNKKHIELNFKGLDTYASVFLNDSLILKTDNAFKEFVVDVKSILKPKNELQIVFQRTTISEEKEKAKLSYQLPEGNRIFTRKAQFQYGWDWGPKLNTSGAWRPVTLNAWNDYKINEIHPQLLDINNDFAHLAINLKSKNNIEQNLDYDIYLNGILSRTQLNNSPINERHSKPLTLTIENPKRWWPHNLGEPYLYNIKLVVKDNERILDSISTKIGLRTIELITEKDSIGASFYFKVNDVPVYMKGANYIPQNSMQNKVTDSHYENLLNNVVDANMNMLRVWGGGIYENDIFYDLCDEKGILVWQDFMFACAMYPGDDEFLKNVQEEAIQNVKRIRNHASIALWCGNNENSEGWHRWGWQSNRSNKEKDEIWHNYLKIFDSILPETVGKYSNTNYWESSPLYGRGNPKYKTEGDAHDWWIWHDGYQFEHLENNVPRFMSEFGFQSFPSYETIRYINQNDTIDIASEGFKNHQKHSRGFQIIDDYMKRDFPVPINPEDYVYVSQLLQAHGITKGIEAHRRAKPYNMGTLFWQLNDCWPAVSWSSIDYFGNWKALHYHAKKSFENLLISKTLQNDTLKIHLINDKPESITSNLQLELMDFDGKIIWRDSKMIRLSLDNKMAYELNTKTLNLNPNEVVLVSKFSDAISYDYFVKPKDLKLKLLPIKQTITKTKEGFNIRLKSLTLQKNVFLNTKTKGHFSDNYFDLLPNQEINIEYKTKAKNLEDLKIKTLNQLIK